MVKFEHTFWVEILIAGNLQKSYDICQEYCDKVGLCVTVEPTRYIYTKGWEDGVRVRLINYPRFPADDNAIRTTAYTLAAILCTELEQQSYSVMTPETTMWISHREADND